jgi:hypothetical protein
MAFNSVIQGSKRHRIPDQDPQLCLESNINLKQLRDPRGYVHLKKDPSGLNDAENH